MNDFWVTHNELRSLDTLQYWRKRVMEERGLTKPVELVIFEDGKVFIHDGHHRLVAMYLQGYYTVRAHEFNITTMKYHEYQEVNPTKGWVTPLNVRTYCRKADFFDYKSEVLKKYNLTKDLDKCREMVKQFGLDRYAEPRKVRNIPQLAKIYTEAKCTT